MNILIISDSHGNIANLKAVMEIAKKSDIKVVIHCGDLDDEKSFETVKSYGLPLYAVSGNADVSLKLKDFLIIDLGGRKIGVTHKPSNNSAYFKDKKLDLIVNGHLHSKYESSETPVKVVRPGAIIKGINFAVYNTETNKIEFVQDDEI